MKQAGRYDQRRAQRKSIKTHSNIRERWEISSIYKYPCTRSHQLYQRRNKHRHHKKLKDYGKERNQKADHRRDPRRAHSDLRRRQECSPALQRREEEEAGTDHHRYPRRRRLHRLGPRGQPSQDPRRREASSAAYPRRDGGQGGLPGRPRSGGSSPGAS